MLWKQSQSIQTENEREREREKGGKTKKHCLELDTFRKENETEGKKTVVAMETGNEEYCKTPCFLLLSE